MKPDFSLCFWHVFDPYRKTKASWMAAAALWFGPHQQLHPLQPGAMRGDRTAGLKKRIPSSKTA